MITLITAKNGLCVNHIDCHKWKICLITYRATSLSSRMMPSLNMMSNDDIEYDDSAFGKRCICWSAFNGDISVAHTRDAEPQFFIPPGGRLLISRISRYGICISCPCALPSMTYISFSTLFWWYTILCGIGIIVENEDAQNVIRCCLRSKMDRGNILLHFHPLWILQWRQKAQRAASGDAFEISYTYFSFCSWLVNQY